MNMKNLDKQTAHSICVYLRRRGASLGSAEKHKLLSVALEKATSLEDYIKTACALASPSCGNDKTRAREVFSTAVEMAVTNDVTLLINVARNVIAPDLLDDKEWGRKILERGVEGATEFGNFVEAAWEASSKEGLSDLPWAKTLLKRAIAQNMDFDSLLEAANVAGRSDAIDDKQWSSELFRQALTMDGVTGNELIQAALLIADDDVLGDKRWGRDLIEQASEQLQFGNDYVMVAICYAHTKKLNDKVRGLEWFERAVGQKSIYAPVDFYEIATLVASKDVLNDHLWATALCETTANNSRNTSELVQIACFVSTIDARAGLAEQMFRRAYEYAETSTDLREIAINVANKLHTTQREWARMIFEQALVSADNNQKEAIKEEMEDYL